VWDLNGFGNSLSMRRATDGRWNSTNAEALLRHVAANHQTAVLKGLQLGNEPGHYSAETRNAPGPAEHGQDFVALRQLLSEVFPDSATRPLIQGPDVCFGKYLVCIFPLLPSHPTPLGSRCCLIHLSSPAMRWESRQQSDSQSRALAGIVAELQPGELHQRWG
jgi:hypothetical protein